MPDLPWFSGHRGGGGLFATSVTIDGFDVAPAVGTSPSGDAALAVGTLSVTFSPQDAGANGTHVVVEPGAALGITTNDQAGPGDALVTIDAAAGSTWDDVIAAVAADPTIGGLVALALDNGAQGTDLVADTFTATGHSIVVTLAGGAEGGSVVTTISGKDHDCIVFLRADTDGAALTAEGFRFPVLSATFGPIPLAAGATLAFTTDNAEPVPIMLVWFAG